MLISCNLFSSSDLRQKYGTSRIASQPATRPGHGARTHATRRLLEVTTMSTLGVGMGHAIRLRIGRFAELGANSESIT